MVQIARTSAEQFMEASADELYGLPNQKEAEWERVCRTVVTPVPLVGEHGRIGARLLPFTFEHVLRAIGAQSGFRLAGRRLHRSMTIPGNRRQAGR